MLLLACHATAEEEETFPVISGDAAAASKTLVRSALEAVQIQADKNIQRLLLTAWGMGFGQHIS